MVTSVESCDLAHDCLHMSVCWDYFILPSSFLERSLSAMPQPWSWYWGHRSPSPLTCSVCEDDGDRCTECSRVWGALQRDPVSPAGTGCISLGFLEGWVFVLVDVLERAVAAARLPLSLGPVFTVFPERHTLPVPDASSPVCTEIILPMDAAGPNCREVNQHLSPATSPSSTQPMMDGN